MQLLKITHKKIFTNNQIKKAQREADYHAGQVKGIKKNLEYKKNSKTRDWWDLSFGIFVEDLKIAESRKKEEDNLVEILKEYRMLLDKM